MYTTPAPEAIALLIAPWIATEESAVPVGSGPNPPTLSQSTPLGDGAVGYHRPASIGQVYSRTLFAGIKLLAPPATLLVPCAANVTGDGAPFATYKSCPSTAPACTTTPVTADPGSKIAHDAVVGIVPPLVMPTASA